MIDDVKLRRKSIYSAIPENFIKDEPGEISVDDTGKTFGPKDFELLEFVGEVYQLFEKCLLIRANVCFSKGIVWESVKSTGERVKDYSSNEDCT